VCIVQIFLNEFFVREGMALFAMSPLSQVLYAVEHAKVLALQGSASETLLSVLGEQEYGEVSVACKEITGELQQGKELEVAVNGYKKKGVHPSVREFLTIIPGVGEQQFYTRMDELSTAVMNQKERMKDTFLSKLQRGIGKSIFIMALPFLLFLLKFLEDAELYAMEIANLDLGVYGIAIVGMVVLGVMMRYRE